MTCYRTASKLTTAITLAWVMTSAPSWQASAFSQDAQSILRTMQQKNEERWQQVENYTIVKSVEAAAGLETPQYFERMTVDGQTTFRLVPPPIYEREMMEAAGFPPPEAAMYGMAMGLDLLGSLLEQGGGDQPPMPGVSLMTGMMSQFLREGAAGLATMGDGSAEAQDAVRDMAEFAERARFAGTEPVVAGTDGGQREAFKLTVEGLEIVQEAPGGTFTLRSTTLWVDTEYYVPIRLLMDGDVESDGQTTPLTIEKLDLDYREHGPIVVPHREVGRLTGILEAMSEEDRREMEEAKEKLAEMEQQLASLPPDQKAMVERMMGGQIEQFRRMVEGKSFESAVNVMSVAVNEGPPTPYGLGAVTVEGEDFPGAITMAAEEENESGRLLATLHIAAMGATGTEISVALGATDAYPGEGGSVAVDSASGSVKYAGGGQVFVESAIGTVSVDVRTDTRIAGSYQAQLAGTDGNGASVTVSISGRFDSGAPAGPYQAPRGSPIPAYFGQTPQ